MFKVFYSWESDLPSSKNRAFIRGCIDKAIELADKAETIEAERDEATKGLTGSPDIVKAIFDKINDSDLFVADVSLCFTNNDKGKKSPNPNVLIELGYAIKVLGWERIICVFNLAFDAPQPRAHLGLWGEEQDSENEDDYEKSLQENILIPESETHYNTTIARMRASENRWLSGGILVKPTNGEVIIDYYIHSALSTGEMRGTLSYSTD